MKSATVQNILLQKIDILQTIYERNHQELTYHLPETGPILLLSEISPFLLTQAPSLVANLAAKEKIPLLNMAAGHAFQTRFAASAADMLVSSSFGLLAQTFYVLLLRISFPGCECVFVLHLQDMAVNRSVQKWLHAASIPLLVSGPRGILSMDMPFKCNASDQSFLREAAASAVVKPSAQMAEIIALLSKVNNDTLKTPDGCAFYPVNCIESFLKEATSLSKQKA